jgi:hypothetical protein
MRLTLDARPPRLSLALLLAAALVGGLALMAGLATPTDEEPLIVAWWEAPALTEGAEASAAGLVAGGRPGLQVVRAPAPVMPADAAAWGVTGSCDVTFDIDIHGRPFNLSAQCTDEIFWGEAVRAVSKAVFLPKIGPHGMENQRGAVYRLEFDAGQAGTDQLRRPR